MRQGAWSLGGGVRRAGGRHRGGSLAGRRRRAAWCLADESGRASPAGGGRAVASCGCVPASQAGAGVDGESIWRLIR